MTAEYLPSVQSIEVERTASNARILEIIFGFGGIFGMGWLYAGNYVAGVIALCISTFLIFPVELGLTIGTVGICSCLLIPMNLVIGFLSGNNARAWSLSKRQTQGSILRVLLGLFIVVAVDVIIATVLGGSLAAWFEAIAPGLPTLQ